MSEEHLYQQIAETIRREIFEGRLKPGERLPSVRALRSTWNCTPGTVQRAYNELAREGLIVSRAGQGTQVAGVIPHARAQAEGALRTVGLVHRAEAFLLEVLTAGYDLREVQSALDLAMDRWRAVASANQAPVKETLRFTGSHDMVVNGLAHHFFGEVAPEAALTLAYTGSQGGLTALAEGCADLIGCHLWDAATQTYNLPFIRRALPGRRVVVVTLAHRRQGLILSPGNPLGLHSLSDLARPEVRFVNRQAGSGTRVWLDANLERLGIQPRQVQGYRDVRLTHSEVARAVADGSADVGLGLETAALAYGLDFVSLLQERYDLVLTAELAERPVLRHLLSWLAGPDGKAFVAQFKGYDNRETGKIVCLDP